MSTTTTTQRKPAATPDPRGLHIEPQNLYTIDEVRGIMRWGADAWFKAQKHIDVRYIGGRGYVMGQAVIDYVLTCGKDTYQ